MTTGTETETGSDSSRLSKGWTPNPLPLEQTDPELAEHLRLIANQQHPAVKCLVFDRRATMYVQHDGTRVIKRRQLPGRNDPCLCGSGSKFKKCCGG
jgi:uncharacterized protein YecA (UPF0149 family)